VSVRDLDSMLPKVLPSVLRRGRLRRCSAEAALGSVAKGSQAGPEGQRPVQTGRKGSEAAGGTGQRRTHPDVMLAGSVTFPHCLRAVVLMIYKQIIIRSVAIYMRTFMCICC
ncbi:unnamed protein product, partial [Polarella glacialis]